MKAFIFTLSIALTLIFTLNHHLDPFEKNAMLNVRKTFIEENTNRCLIDNRLMTIGPELKLALFETLKPDTIVIGTSRVMAFRQKHFQTNKMINFGVSGTTLTDYFYLLKIIKKNKSVKKIYISFDPWEYSKTGENRIYDSLNKINFPFLKYFYLFMHPGAYNNVLSRYWETFKSNLSFLSTKKSIETILTNKSFSKKKYILDLPQYTATDSTCILSSTPEINRNGAVSSMDGSQYTPEELHGLQIKTDRSEYDSTLVHEQGTHWRLYDPFKFSAEFSKFKIDLLMLFLKECSKEKIEVIGFTQTFPMAVHTVFKDLHLKTIFDDFENIMEKSFEQTKQKFVKIQPAETLGCSPEGSFTDAWHPWDHCCKEVLKKLNTN